jgi:LacI family transcriptional regulator
MVDVERKAGVSLKTVSRHVNGATNIAPELDDRIREAIRDLGYRRNHSAASIRPGRRSGVVGVIIEDIGNPFYSAPVRGRKRCSSRRGWLLR